MPRRGAQGSGVAVTASVKDDGSCLDPLDERGRRSPSCARLPSKITDATTATTRNHTGPVKARETTARRIHVNNRGRRAFGAKEAPHRACHPCSPRRASGCHLGRLLMCRIVLLDTLAGTIFLTQGDLTEANAATSASLATGVMRGSDAELVYTFNHSGSLCGVNSDPGKGNPSQLVAK